VKTQSRQASDQEEHRGTSQNWLGPNGVHLHSSAAQKNDINKFFEVSFRPFLHTYILEGQNFWNLDTLLFREKGNLAQSDMKSDFWASINAYLGPGICPGIVHESLRERRSAA
jgi:hypothetical protein